MKFLVIFFLAFAATSAHYIEFDWSNIRPVQEYPKFWDDKPQHLRPPTSYFTRERSRRIVNGQIAQPHQFPYQAGLLFNLPSIGGVALCGGALISTRTVLTAAHCVDGSTGGTVILGAHFLNQIEPNQQRIQVTPAGIIMHPLWNPLLIRDDIAVLHLSAAANLVANIVAPISLPPETGETFANEDSVVSGWGRFDDNLPQSSDVLRFYRGTILTHAACAIRFPGVVQTSHICLSGVNNGGACQGDSGGPLTTTYRGAHTHIGVVSFGLALGCELTWPSVFGRTSSYIPWIHANTVG